MRIAFLMHGFPAVATTFVLRQLAAFLDRGHDVTVYARHRLDDGVEHQEVALYGLPERTRYLAELPPADTVVWGRAPTGLGSGCHDVLNVQMGHAARDFLFARQASAAPLVVTFHGFDFSAYPRMAGEDCYRAVFDVADAVTYNCEHARRRLLDLGCPPGKLAKYVSALDVERLPFRERRLERGEPLRILTVARLAEKKGIDVGLRAVAGLRRRGVDLRYDVVGEGPTRKQLETLVEELALGNIVRLHGARDGLYVRERLADAHVFMLPSVTAPNGDQEGTPVSLMEAQACGLPVLSTVHSGIPEVVLDGRSGLLVPEGDPEALTDGIERLVAREREWPRMGQLGREHIARNFDLACWTDRILDVYGRVGAASASAGGLGPRVPS